MIIQLYKEILLCFLNRNYVMRTPLNELNPMNGQYQLINSNLYLGAKVMIFINDPQIIKEDIRMREFFDRYKFINEIIMSNVFKL